MRSKLSVARRRVMFGDRRGRLEPSPQTPPAREPDAGATPLDGRLDPAGADARQRTREMLPASASTPAQREFHIERSDAGGVATITPVGELDGASAVAFEETLSEVIAARRPIMLDLRRLTFIDSSGLWAITLIHKTCKRRGIALCLLPGPEHVQSVFEVTGLYDVLPFAGSGEPFALAQPGP